MKNISVLLCSGSVFIFQLVHLSNLSCQKLLFLKQSCRGRHYRALQSNLLGLLFFFISVLDLFHGDGQVDRWGDAGISVDHGVHR